MSEAGTQTPRHQSGWHNDVVLCNGGTPVIVHATGGTNTSLAVVGGYPAIVFRDNSKLMFCQTLDFNGTSWGPRVEIDSGNFVYTSLLDIGGYPAISYHDITNDDLKFVRLY